MRLAVVLVATLLSSCPLDDDLVKVCNEPVCWLDRGGTVHTETPPFELGAECHLGTVICKDGEVTGCKDFDPPELEQCNQLDDDCNGMVDEGLDRLWYEGDNTCEPGLGVCATQDQRCVDGQVTCIPVMDHGDEVCDLLDNDCDGEVDEGIPSEFFYPEEEFPGTVGLGDCRPGVRRCVDGRSNATPAVIPRPEVCESGQDEDCDGLTDENENGNLEGRFVLVIDISGSMAGVIDDVMDAVCSWSSDATFSWSVFAVIVIGDLTTSMPWVSIAQDFADATATCATLSTVAGMTGSGDERQLSAVLLSEQLSWPEGADRHVVVFTDEEIHPSYEDEDLDVQSSCLDFGYEVGVFTTPSVSYQWSDIEATCGGFIDYLDDDDDMADALRAYFNGSC